MIYETRLSRIYGNEYIMRYSLFFCVRFHVQDARRVGICNGTQHTQSVLAMLLHSQDVVCQR